MGDDAAENGGRASGSALVYAGIDEAGYGPMLGPLCVGLSVFRLRAWDEAIGAPDMWTMLRAVVCRDAASARDGKRIAVNDSKKLKGPGGPGEPRSLGHLERAVLCALACAGARIGSDADLLDALHADLGASPWYAGEPFAMPFNADGASIAIQANTLAAALDRAGVECLALRVGALHEGAFNDLCDRHNSKAAANFSLVARALRRVWTDWAARPAGAATGGARIVVDRQGGRTSYARVLAAAFEDASVVTLEETARVSRYLIEGVGPTGEPRAMTVQFLPEAEQRHFPVALASMAAKLVREVAMLRFNRHWVERKPGLAPTAGYVADARRWLRDAHDAISPRERELLVRKR